MSLHWMFGGEGRCWKFTQATNVDLPQSTIETKWPPGMPVLPTAFWLSTYLTNTCWHQSLYVSLCSAVPWIRSFQKESAVMLGVRFLAPFLSSPNKAVWYVAWFFPSEVWAGGLERGRQTQLKKDALIRYKNYLWFLIQNVILGKNVKNTSTQGQA